jgi:hypothetical protein
MLLQKLRVRLSDKNEHAQWNGLMEKHYYLVNGTSKKPFPSFSFPDLG